MQCTLGKKRSCIPPPLPSPPSIHPFTLMNFRKTTLHLAVLVVQDESEALKHAGIRARRR